MTLKSRKSKSLIVTILLAGSTVCYVACVFLPGQKAIAKLRTEFQDRQQIVLASEHLTYAITTAEEELNAAKAFAEQWRTSAPRDPEPTELHAVILEAAKESNVRIMQFAPATSQKMAAIVKVPLTMSVEGSFRQIFDFVRKIESMPETIWIDGLNIEPLRRARRERKRDDQVEHDEVGHLWGLGSLSDDGAQLTCNLTLTIFADNRDFSD